MCRDTTSNVRKPFNGIAPIDLFGIHSFIVFSQVVSFSLYRLKASASVRATQVFVMCKKFCTKIKTWR
jgi:hypothetical protein